MKKKSDLMTIRLEPSLKFSLELLARKKGLSMSQAAANAIWEALDKEGLAPSRNGEPESAVDLLWDEDELTRAERLQAFDPTLLLPHERELLRLAGK